MKKNIMVLVLLTGLFCIAGLRVDAQSFFSRSLAGKGPTKDAPTVITSDAMDFDITKNVAVFTGNVQVDDANMRILCHQMIIRFEGNAASLKDVTSEKKEKVEKKSVKDGDDPKANTKVKSIECIKNVIIIRKLYDGKEKEGGEQKAIAGHALYDVKTGKITLTDHPALVRGSDTLRGEMIIYWVDSERVSVRSGNQNTSELKIRSKQK